MSSNSADEDFSEGSELLSGSTATSGSAFVVSMTPPSFDECVFQSQLYFVFLRFLLQLKANENLVFFKRATVFSLLRRPVKEKYMGACKIIFNFLSDSSPTPVNVSAETKNKLLPVLWRKDGIKLVNDHMFDEAMAEIKVLLIPYYNKWVETNEWQRVPFFHAPPPTIPIILRIPALRTGFGTFLAERREEINPPKTADADLKQFHACVELFDVITQTKAKDVSKKEAETIARHFLKAHKAEYKSLPVVCDLEMPSLHHKKKKDGADDEEEDDSISCVDFIGEAFDSLSEDMMERECYEYFLDEKNWSYIEVLKASLQQTIDKDGYVEYPSLGAILHSPTYGHLIMDTLKGTEKNAQMHFLLEAQEFYSHYATGHKLHTQDRKMMISDARRIFDAYILKNTLELPKRLRNEIVKTIHSPVGRITPSVFQLAGAWVFNRIDSSWMREVNSMVLWSDHDFDNEAPVAKEMERMFDMSYISSNPSLANEGLDLVPHPDDILGNPKLMESFVKMVPSSEYTKACFTFLQLAKEIMAHPPEAQAQECKTLKLLLGVIAKESKDTPIFGVLLSDIGVNMEKEKEAFNPGAFLIPAFLVGKVILGAYYKEWTLKCKSAYKNGGWVPVKRLTYVSNDAIPGTSWIPSVGLPADAASKSMPVQKKKWSLMDKIRGVSNSDSISVDVGKQSKSASHSPKTVVLSPREESKSPLPESSSPLASSPLVSPVSVNEPVHKRTPSSQSSHFPSSVPRSVPAFRLEIPTIHDSLGTVHLRRLFYSVYLEPRLNEDEKKLWKDLCKFNSDYSAFGDAEIAKRQKDIRDAATKLLEQNPTIPDHDDLLKTLKESTYNISSRFFLDSEIKLYGSLHDSYQTFLANKQWVRY